MDRGLIREEDAQKVLVNCPDYVKKVCEYQKSAIEASQLNVARVGDLRAAKRDKLEVPVKVFKAGDLVLTGRHGGSKLDFKWKGPFRVLESLESNIYRCVDLRNGKVLEFDVSSLRLFKCPAGVDPISIAGMDESEFRVDAVLKHKLEGLNRKNKTHYYFLVKFQDGEEDWLPYMEVRELEAFGKYLQDHSDFARLLKLKI